MLSHKKHLNGFFLAVCLVLLAGSVSFAQGNEELKATPEQIGIGSMAKSSAYYYPNFKKGKVTFITGTANSGVLNYNVLTEEVAYISSKKDTLIFDEMYLIDMITVESDTFYYDMQGSSVLKLLNNVKGRKLLVKENQENNTAAFPRTYYVSNKSDYIQATAPNLVSLFPSHATTLQKYIQEHNLELNSEEEIRQVLEFAGNL